MSYTPIVPIKTSDALGMFETARVPEAAGKTFKPGVPLILVGGYLEEATFLASQLVYGFSAEAAHNLSVAGTAQEYSEGSPLNQPSASIIPVGAWMRDGRVMAYKATGKVIFRASLKAAQVFTQALVAAGTLYGLVKDGTTGLWYVDTADTSGDNAVVRILEVDPSSPNTATDCHVFIQIDSTKRYFN